MRRLAATPCACLLLAACTTSPTQLFFADQTTVGLRLGTETEGLASASLGYKAQSVAIVPVTALNADGEPEALLSGHGGRQDAPSVFAVFRAKSDDAKKVRLSQMFSTGVAAQLLTQGIDCQLSGDSSCKPRAPAATEAAPAEADDAKTKVKKPAGSAEGPRQPALVYLRSDVYGIDIGAATKEQGVGFVLGYSNENLALVPVYARSRSGHPATLIPDQPKGQPQDALSVLGQFDSTTETQRFGLGLDRYFSTGLASQNLARGLRAQLAKPPAPAASQ